jgi:hypothetical protein
MALVRESARFSAANVAPSALDAAENTIAAENGMHSANGGTSAARPSQRRHLGGRPP